VRNNEAIPLKNLSLCVLLIGIGVLLAYIFIIALISIHVGLNHLQQDGYWVPVLAGTLSIIGCLWLFLFISRIIMNKMKEKEIII
jgi:hypothetical protein